MKRIHVFMQQKTQKHFVIGLGSATLDHLQVVDVFPESNTKNSASHVDIQGGGSGMTALVTLSRLGVKTGAISCVGDDFIGKEIVRDLKSYGVDTRGVQIKKGGTSPLSSVIVSEHEHRTIISNYQLESAMKPATLPKSWFQKAHILHLDGHFTGAALAACRLAKEHGVLISLDASHYYPGIKKILPLVDILITSEHFPQNLGIRGSAEKAVCIMHDRFQPLVTMVTVGKRGVYYYDGKDVERMPIFSVPVVDTTGAGDVFHGAFLYGYLQRWPLTKSVRFAVAASSIKVGSLGPRRGIPTLEEVRRFLEKRKSVQSSER